MKIFIILLAVITMFVPFQLKCCEVNNRKWSDYKSKNLIVLGEQDAGKEILKIRLIEPEVILEEGSGGYEDKEGNDISTFAIGTENHGFECTSEGDLFIDNLYVGRFSKKDELVYGDGRIWSNGVPCFMKKMTIEQKKNLYMEFSYVEPDGSRLVHNLEWKIYLSPGAGGNLHRIDKSYIYIDGMTVVRIEEGKLMVNGINYGRIESGQIIKVIDYVVMVDSKILSPASVAKQTANEK